MPFAVQPSLRFLQPTRALVEWEFPERFDAPAAVAFGPTRELGPIVPATRDGVRASILLEGLDPHTTYFYRIGARLDSGRLFSPVYTFDTSLNYSVASLNHLGAQPPPPSAAVSDSAGRALAAAFGSSASGHAPAGFALVLGLEDASLAVAIAARSRLSVIGVDADPERIHSLRLALTQSGVYGARVSLFSTESFDDLPFTGGMFNLVVSETSLTTGRIPSPPKEVLRVLQPGGLARFEGPEQEANPIRRWPETEPLFSVPSAPEDPGVAVIEARQPSISGAGSWTHQYGDAGNTADSRDTLSGVDSAQDLQTQWVGRPGGDFGIDRNPRMPAPLSVSNRLFHQGMNRMIALDAHNGSVLWSLEAPGLRRVNIPRDASNWCADASKLYVAVGDRAWILDPVSGARTSSLALPETDRLTHDWGFIARSGDFLLGSSVLRNAPYTEYWSDAMWYDGKDTSATAQVCSDALFAYPAADPRAPLAWEHRGGIVINTSICASGDQLFFAESRNPEVRANPSRRLAGELLTRDLFAVALDLSTGSLLWENALDLPAQALCFYGLAAPGSLIFVTSSEGQFHLRTLDPESGKERWRRSNPWADDHHSGHIQHPVALGNRLYLQPFGMRLGDGSIFTENMGRREGCHTYVGAGHALLFRGADRQISVWSLESEKTTHWPRLRPSCWLSVIPANGMLLMPEGGGGCSCGGWMETSLGFRPIDASSSHE
ncbi:MAG TPA: PQQ-binding-like beta-propeller repeat protein [Verrucomicrobiales bacterium]|nr:PQQ-binding-like beta-propeller repeat protein [Verrucomicrobiales bacterium]